MSLFYPDYWFERIADIPPAFFVSRGIRLVLLDVDNTLTTHNNPSPAPGVADWLARMREAGLTLAILSNNHGRRVAPFARQLRLSFVANGAKPFPFRLARACRRYGVTPGQCALVGDQLFTDILCGNLLPGALSVLVTPLEPEQSKAFRLKRRLERPILRRCRQRHGERIFSRKTGKEL